MERLEYLHSIGPHWIGNQGKNHEMEMAQRLKGPAIRAASLLPILMPLVREMLLTNLNIQNYPSSITKAPIGKQGYGVQFVKYTRQDFAIPLWLAN